MSDYFGQGGDFGHISSKSAPECCFCSKNKSLNYVNCKCTIYMNKNKEMIEDANYSSSQYFISFSYLLKKFYYLFWFSI